MKRDPANDKEGIEGEDSLQRAREDLFAVERDLRTPEISISRDQDALSKLLNIVEQVNAELEIERVLNVAAQQIIEVFEAERVFIMDVGPEDRIWFRLAVSFQGRPVVTPANEVSHAVIQEVARKRAPILVADATTDPRFAMVSSVHHLELHSVMAAPLLARGELLGVVYADNRTLSGAFGPHTLNLLGIFANHLGIALRNAQLFQDLNVARAELALSERLRAIGQVATFVAHEVKNPLASIRILVDALQEKWTDQEFRAKVFQVVPREVARLDKAVNQILAYARPTPLVKVPVQVASLLESSLRTLEPQIKRDGIRVVRDFQPGLPAVLADGERLREVFINLITNSLEAMVGRPGKELHIKVQWVDQAHEEVIIEDNGPGIPEAVIPKIFEPFRSYKESGTGVGLSLCQKVIREHAGQITVENAATGGARFRIRLPVRGT